MLLGLRTSFCVLKEKVVNNVAQKKQFFPLTTLTIGTRGSNPKHLTHISGKSTCFGVIDCLLDTLLRRRCEAVSSGVIELSDLDGGVVDGSDCGVDDGGGCGVDDGGGCGVEYGGTFCVKDGGGGGGGGVGAFGSVFVIDLLLPV